MLKKPYANRILFDVDIMSSLKIILIIIVILMTACLSDCQMKCAKQRKNSNSRIYRGKDATKNMFPWYIDLTIGYPDIKDPNSKNGFVERFGGGALISKLHILTAAHLFYPHMKKKLVSIITFTHT